MRLDLDQLIFQSTNTKMYIKHIKEKISDFLEILEIKETDSFNSSISRYSDEGLRESK